MLARYRVIKGRPQDLTDSVKKNIIGLRKTEMGYAKARYWSMIPFMILFVLVIIPEIMNKLIIITAVIMFNKTVFSLIAVIAGGASLILFYYVSLILYRKRR